MATPQVVFATNLGPLEFSKAQLEYENAHYELPIGIRKVIPYGAMISWFGDPLATDDDRNQDRRREHDRLRTWWGCQPADVIDTESMIPKVLCENIDTEERYWTVLDDPEGKHIGTVDPKSTESRNLNNMIKTLQAQVEQLQKQQNLETTEVSAAPDPEFEQVFDAKPEELEDDDD